MNPVYLVQYESPAGHWIDLRDFPGVCEAEGYARSFLTRASTLKVRVVERSDRVLDFLPALKVEKSSCCCPKKRGEEGIDSKSSMR